MKGVLRMTMGSPGTTTLCAGESLCPPRVYTQPPPAAWTLGAAAAPFTSCPPGALPDLPTAKEQGSSSFSAWQGWSPGTESCQGLFQSSKFQVGWLLEAYQLPASAKGTFLSHRFVTMGEW